MAYTPCFEEVYLDIRNQSGCLCVMSFLKAGLYCRSMFDDISKAVISLLICAIHGNRYSKTPQTRTYVSEKQTDKVLTNEVIMKFSRCYSYRKDTCYYDEYIAIQYVSKKLGGRMAAFKY